MFAYSSKTDESICAKFGMLISWDHENILERSKLREFVLSSSTGKGSTYSSKTKHYRTAPRKLFVSKRSVQKQGHCHATSLGFVSR
jgi:hypothetical protein